MISPSTADFIQKRLHRVAVQHHQSQREIRGDKGPHQRPKRQQCQGELRPGGGLCHGHPTGPAFMGTNQGHDHLNDGNAEGEDKGEMSELCNHTPIIERCSAPYHADSPRNHTTVRSKASQAPLTLQPCASYPAALRQSVSAALSDLSRTALDTPSRSRTAPSSTPSTRSVSSSLICRITVGVCATVRAIEC